MPVDGSKIAGFKTWLCWNGFHPLHHQGFDFACYLTKDNKIILGLPPEVEIYSVLDGTVKGILHTAGLYSFSDIINGADPTIRRYFCNIVIEHEIENKKLYSIYCHVNPMVNKGQWIRKGEPIAKLYKSPGKYAGCLVHLHFALCQNNPIKINANVPWIIRVLSKPLRLDLNTIGDNCLVDPATIFPSLNSYLCYPQCSPKFSIARLNLKSQNPVIANFKILQLTFKPRKPKKTPRFHGV